jgi:hypothetical protein
MKVINKSRFPILKTAAKESLKNYESNDEEELIFEDNDTLKSKEDIRIDLNKELDDFLKKLME